MGTYSLSDRLSDDQSWRIPYRQFANQDALGLTEGMSDITEQFGRQRQELAQKTQDKFGGGHVSGFGLAADRAERKAKKDLMHASAMRGMQASLQEAQQASAIAEAEKTRHHQLKLAELNAAENALARAAQAEQNRLSREQATESQKRALRTQVAMQQRSLEIQKANVLANLRRSGMQYGFFGGGGGGGMSVSYSTGADTFARHLQNMGVIG